MKKLVFLFILVLPGGSQQLLKRGLMPSKMPNVLIVSFCSLSSKRLPIFGSGSENDTPNFTEVFKKSINFTNAFTDLSWSNIGRFLRRHEMISFYLKSYKELSGQKFDIARNAELEGRATFRIPENFDDYTEYFGPREEELRVGIREALDIIKNREKAFPFLFQIHIKFMHTPYLPIEIARDESKLNSFLSRDEVKLLLEYQKNYLRYPEKIPFFQAMFPNQEIVSHIEATFGRRVMLVTNKDFILKWKRSVNFDKDLTLLKKVYAFRIRQLDSQIRPLLDYYNSQLSQDTVLVMTGDHGEAFLEHGYLTHAADPFDEVLRFFFSVHFPEQEESRIIGDQLSQLSASDLIKEIAILSLNRNKIDAFVKSSRMNSDLIFSYSCDGTKISARLKNKWKLIYYLVSNKVALFDLQNDPSETVDVHEKNIEIVNQLKADLERNLLKRRIRPNGCIG